MSDKVVTLTEATFDEVINASEEPILVDFWAEWCGPCKMVAPILDEIAEEQEGKVTIAKLNIDEHQSIPMRYNVMSIPSMLLFKDGEVTHTVVGAKSKAQLIEELGL